MYDANVNWKSDGNKGITNITYNYLNLPTRIQFIGDAVIEFTYDASGRKWVKPVRSSERKDGRYYVDGMECQKEQLDMIHHSEGSVRRDADGVYGILLCCAIIWGIHGSLFRMKRAMKRWIFKRKSSNPTGMKAEGTCNWKNR